MLRRVSNTEMCVAARGFLVHEILLSAAHKTPWKSYLFVWIGIMLFVKLDYMKSICRKGNTRQIQMNTANERSNVEFLFRQRHKYSERLNHFWMHFVRIYFTSGFYWLHLEIPRDIAQFMAHARAYIYFSRRNSATKMSYFCWLECCASAAASYLLIFIFATNLRNIFPNKVSCDTDSPLVSRYMSLARFLSGSRRKVQLAEGGQDTG